jgi:S1-C subfamily serine protease
VEAFGSDNDYVVRFATGFKHAVEACGGKPSLFADSDRRDERAHTAPSGVAVQSAPLRKDIPSIAKAANGAIVSIVMSDKDGKAIAQGSGFVVSKDGMIITNYHVIAEGSSAVVKLPDGAVYLVDGVLASDKARDVAVIKAHGENFRTLTLGDSDRVQVGEEVVAIGNPLSLESTVSNGIVSAIRTVEDKGGKFVQITAPISPGSSGGPLFNMAGEVVGITSAGIKGGENLNFAIPINDVKPMISSVSEARRDGVSALPDEPEDDKTAVGQTNPAVATPATNNPPSLDDTVKFLNDVVQPDAASSVVADPNCEIEMLNNALPTLMLPSGGVHVSRVDASGIKHYELNYSKLKFATPRYSVIFLSTIDPTSIKSYPAFSEELIARERPGDENPDGLKHPDLTVVRFDTRNKELTILQGTRQESEGGMFITDKTASAELVVFQSKDRAERFVTAFVHAVNLCGGKPSDFAPTPRE